MRPVTRWHCEWNIEDDSNLMKGVYEYGMGSWDQIQADPSLGLSNKVKPLLFFECFFCAVYAFYFYLNT